MLTLDQKIIDLGVSRTDVIHMYKACDLDATLFTDHYVSYEDFQKLLLEATKLEHARRRKVDLWLSVMSKMLK